MAHRGNNRGVAVVDLNQDGWLDVVKASIEGEVWVMLARCGAEAWLEFELQQPGMATPDAVGAQVRVTHGGHTWVRTVYAGGTSFGVGLPPEVHFGLGDLPRVDQVTVRWPDGEVSELGPLDTHQRVVVTR